MSATVNKGPRERIMDAAFELFYHEGLNTTGIDRIIAKARVAKASFYDHFKSKDALIGEYVRARHADFGAWFAREMSTGPVGGRERLLYVLEVIENFTRQKGFRGCAFIAALEQLPEADHPGRVEAAKVKREVREMLVGLAHGAGAADPARVGALMATLVDGVLVAARMGESAGRDAAKAARWAAERVLG